MKIWKIAKHASDKSYKCGICGGFLNPSSFSKNPNHHFPWGIEYYCGCGKSGVWTNSIRGDKEFYDMVIKNKLTPKINSSVSKGFCNDLFCPFCFGYVMVLKNGLYMDASGNFSIYVPSFKKELKITDLQKFMSKVNRGEIKSMTQIDPSFLSDEKITPIAAADISGCEKCNNNSLIRMGYESEYKESEYYPIYKWCLDNKNKIPREMLEEIKGSI